MTKRLISLFLTAAVFFCSGCAGGQGQKIVGNDTAITSRLENMVELQKNIFVGEILSVATEDAIITKYNIDLTKYTVYTVNITRSIDGYTPTGKAVLFGNDGRVCIENKHEKGRDIHNRRPAVDLRR